MSIIVGLIIYLGIGFTFLKISEANGNSYNTGEKLFVVCLLGPWVCMAAAALAAGIYITITILGESVLILAS